MATAKKSWVTTPLRLKSHNALVQLDQGGDVAAFPLVGGTCQSQAHRSLAIGLPTLSKFVRYQGLS